MRVREAALEDRSAWDSFVDGEGGSFSLYFDWKYVHEVGGGQFIPLLIETAPSHLVGILPIVKENHLLYSTLDSGRGGGAQGLLLKKELSDNERGEATSRLLEYVDTHYSRRCSSFKLAEAPASFGKLSEEPTAALVNSGFRFRYDRATGLPCDFVLRLRQPFEETILKEWPRRQRQYLSQAARSGVVVIQDRELRYAEDFVDMASGTIERHGARPPARDEFMVQLKVFREKTKLFVALLDGQPIVTLLCHYTPSTCYLARVGSHEKDTDNANKLCWKAAIEDACNTGLRFADFGYTDTESLAFFKGRFRGTRVPVRTYEKRYSILRTTMEKAPGLVNWALHNKSYIWSNRRRLSHLGYGRGQPSRQTERGL
jgi:hypothetical protein